MSEVGGKTTRYVGVEVSSKSLTAVCIDENGVLSATDSVAVDFRETSSKQVAAFIQSLKGKFGPFDIVGVAVPGLVSRDAKSIAFSASVSNLYLSGTLTSGINIDGKYSVEYKFQFNPIELIKSLGVKILDSSYSIAMTSAPHSEQNLLEVLLLC